MRLSMPFRFEKQHGSRAGRILLLAATCAAQTLPNCPNRPAAVPLASVPPALAAAGQQWAQSLAAAASAGGVASVQYAAHYRNLTIVNGAWGAAQRSPLINATVDTLYRFCSITKAFTSLLLHQTVAAGRVGLDDTLQSIVPEFSMYDPWEGTNGRGITLRHLASHMAGFGRVTPEYINTTAQALQAFATVGGMARPAGLTPQYSNPGFATLGHAIAERVLNRSYDAVLTDMMQQLGVSSGMGIEFTPDVFARFASGYADSTDTPVPFQNLTFDGPAGMMYGNAGNLSLVAQMLMAAAAGEASPVGLPPPLAREMLAPLWIAQDGSFQQGTPWEMFMTPADTGSYLVRGKDGGMNGYSSYFAFVPELHLSLAMMWNGEIPVIPNNDSMAMLVPPLVDALMAVQPLPDAGPNPLDYVGDYAASDIISTGIVSYNASAGLSFWSFNTGSFMLGAVPNRTDTFFQVPGPQPCAYLFGGGPYTYIVFTRSAAGNVTGFTTPYLYQVTWEKV